MELPARRALQASTVDPPQLTDMELALNTGWVLSMAFHILIMQGGFAALEVGCSPSASAAAVAMKNMTDLAVACVAFFLVGWAFAFGRADPAVPSNPFIGNGGFLLVGETDLAKFMLQYSYAATAATILSGAIIGRIRFKHYLLLTTIVSGFLYPIPAHSAWATEGFLYTLGFTDFAGSCMVHAAGGTLGLVASLWLGARPGVFRSDGQYAPHRSSPTQALLGTIALWYAWFGFNSGSTLGLTHNRARTAALAAVNTLVASGGGLVTSIAVSWLRSRGRYIDVFNSAMGLLSGLVGITAGCASVQPWEAGIIGCICAFLAFYSARALERLRIDDAVAVVPVHFVAGVAGTILVGFFANNPATTSLPLWNRHPGLFHGGDGTLLGVQVLGLIYVIAWNTCGFLLTALVVGGCMGGLKVPHELQADLDEREHSDVPSPAARTKPGPRPASLVESRSPLGSSDTDALSSVHSRGDGVRAEP
jgi:ammonium transporter, Amt family